MPPKSVNTRSLDKGSSIADTTPNIKFMSPDEHDFPVIAFRCTNAVGTIMITKEWLFTQYDAAIYGGPEILRMEEQEVEKVRHWEEGTLLLLEHAAWIEGLDGKLPVRIMALVMPKDPRVRFWYSSMTSFNGLLLRLDQEKYIQVKKTFERDNRHHHRLFVWIRDAFMDTLKVPHHPDYTNAMEMTDYSPDIDDPDTAIYRVKACEILYSSKDASKDLSDDRYTLSIDLAECEIASQVQVSCAEYLLIKRNFFKDWYVEVYRSDKRVKDGEIVRTMYAHEQYLEKVYDWTVRRSRRLLAGWRALGLLDQSKIAPWVMKGGMLADDVADMSEEEVGRLQGQGGGKDVANPRRA